MTKLEKLLLISFIFFLVETPPDGALAENLRIIMMVLSGTLFIFPTPSSLAHKKKASDA